MSFWRADWKARGKVNVVYANSGVLISLFEAEERGRARGVKRRRSG